MNSIDTNSAQQTTFLTGEAREFFVENRKVLIVAAESQARRLTDILRPEGYVVVNINSTGEAIDCYAELEPDVVLLDVELPGVHVFELCRYLKSFHGSGSAAVVFIAHRSDPAEVVEGLAAGGVDFLSSPFREQEVLARIRVHLLNRLRLSQLKREEVAKNRLLCMAAHDLRNPLVSIRALTHLVRSGTAGEVNPAQHDLLDTIYEASQSMLDLVNDLLDVSVVGAGELQLTPRPASISQLVESCVRLSNATAAQKASQIVLVPGNTPSILSIDEPKVRQVLNNLLGNAIKFSPPGSTITVVTDCTASECIVAVRDEGPGVHESERKRLFKDFSRTSTRPTGGESSTGLGLSICYKIMQAHAGTIAVGDAPEGGAEFRISFPIAT